MLTKTRLFAKSTIIVIWGEVGLGETMYRVANFAHSLPLRVRVNFLQSRDLFSCEDRQNRYYPVTKSRFDPFGGKTCGFCDKRFIKNYVDLTLI